LILSNQKKTPKGIDCLLRTDIHNLKLIYNLVKERGFTLEGAKQKLKKNPKSTLHTHQIISKLEAVKAALLQIKNKL
jgi:hypothetical protein